MSVNGSDGPLTEGEFPDRLPPAVAATDPLNGREAALLHACDGDTDQLQRVQALLARRPAAEPLLGLAPPKHTYDVEVRQLSIVEPRRKRVRLTNITEDVVLPPKPVTATVKEIGPDCCHGLRATRLATSAKDLEENPGDFRCGSCGRLLDSPQGETGAS